MKDKLLELINDHKIITVMAITVFFLFIVPPIINWIATSKFTIFFITKDNQGTWIGFYGAIIGGGMTLIGVNMTIVRQNKIHDEQLMTQYRPIVLLNDSNFECTDYYDSTSFDFKLVNAGRGEATNVKIDVKIDSANEISDYLLSYKGEFPIIVSDSEINYKIYLELDYEKYYLKINDELKEISSNIVIEDSSSTTDSTTTYPPFPYSKLNLEVVIKYSDFKGNHYESRLLIFLNRHHSLLRKKREKDYISHWTNKIEFLEYKKIDN